MNKPLRFRIGEIQIAALWQECLESIHAELGDEFAFPGSIVDSVLIIDPGGEARAVDLLRDAVEGMHQQGDHEYRDALAAILARLERAMAPAVVLLSAEDARAARDAALTAYRGDPCPDTEHALQAAHRAMVQAIDAAK